MTAIAHLTAADYVRQRWKNGGGTTTELCRDGDRDRWRWRVSVADVERSGPFSDFAGYRRIIVLLEGRGMALSMGDEPPVVLDRPYRPFAFDGGLRTECTLLDGPVRDLNLIFDEARVDASVDVHRLQATSLRFGVAESMLLHALAGHVRVELAHRAFTLAPHDTLRIDACTASTLAVTPVDGVAMLVRAAFERRRRPA